MKVILLGSFRGNNAGDMVVLESVINDFNRLLLVGESKKENSVFMGMGSVTEIELIVPTMNKNGLAFIHNMARPEKGMVIRPIPISKNPVVVVKAVLALIKEFPKADYIYTTAGILFDRKIWNPFYNFVVVYTPLLRWAKFKNPKVKIIGYNVGITSGRRMIGRNMLKQCIALHDRIYLREERDAALLKQFRYKGNMFLSTDNVFGYGRPITPHKHQYSNIYINLTLTGVKDKRHFIHEMASFVRKIKDRYNVCFFQTSKRDLGAARAVCEKAYLGETCIYDVCLAGYQQIENLLSECDILIGMRMHSLIFALKGGCPVIAMNYSTKTVSLMQDIHLEKFLVDINGISEKVLSDKVAAVLAQREDIVRQIYVDMEKRYSLCNCYK